MLQFLLKTHWELIWELFGKYLGTIWELCLFHAVPPQTAQGHSRYRRFLSLASFVEQGCQRAPSRICVWAHEFKFQKKTAVDNSAWEDQRRPACSHKRLRDVGSCVAFSDTCSQMGVMSDGRRKHYCDTCVCMLPAPAPPISMLGC